MKSPLSAPLWTRFVIGIVLALLYVPVLWMVVRAFGGPSNWGLQWFESAVTNTTWMSALGRSIFVAIVAGLVSTTLGLGAAVSSRSKLGPWIEIFSVMALVLPELVFALSLLSWFVVLKLDLSLWTVVIAHVTFSLSFSHYLILSRFKQIDISLEEAAQDLGATAWQSFTRVLFPLLVPSLGVSFMLCFLLSFDDFLISFFVSGVGSDTLPIKLYSSMKLGLTPQLHALACLMSLISSVALYLVLNSRAVRPILGISEGPSDQIPAIPDPH